MEWNEKLQVIIDYVEIHLQRDEEPICNEEISKLAECSFDFFQKVFSYMNGLSFSEYVRYRKMTLAGYDVKSSRMKIVDISYKYGYDSPTSFTKAFQQFHGVSPKEARNKNVELRVYAKMQIELKQEYTWRVQTKKTLRLIGKKISIDVGEEYQRIPEFWSESQRDGTFLELVSLDEGNPKGMFGICGYDKSYQINEYAMMVISNQELPKGFEEIIIPEATWAIFDCYGMVPKSIQNAWQYLNQEWIVKYPFQHAQCPELEWYSEGNTYSHDYLSQIWIPIIEGE